MGLPERTNPRTLELDTAPDFLAARNSLFENLKQTRDAWVAEQPRTRIEIKYQRENKPARSLLGTSWQTTPASIARQVSIRSELDRWIVARVDGQLWDIERPLEKDCVLELLDFDHPDGKKTFWESSAHILGNAAERRFGCLLNQSEARQDGFMHEWRMPESSGVGSTITKADYKPLHRLSHKIINKALLFERLEVKRTDLLELFAYNKYKLHVIKALNDDTTAVVYRCGEYIDLCEGPLIHNTGKVKAFELVKNSSSYFNGDAANDSLQRIYGISFPDKKVSIRSRICGELRTLTRGMLGTRRPQKVAGTSGTARSSQDRPRARTILLSLYGFSWISLFLTVGSGHLQHFDGVYARGVLEAGLSRSHDAEHVQFSIVEDLRTLGAL